MYNSRHICCFFFLCAFGSPPFRWLVFVKDYLDFAVTAYVPSWPPQNSLCIWSSHTHTRHTVTQDSFLIMCPLKAVSLKGGAHVNTAVSCVLEGETGLFHMCNGGFYVTVGLTRTYHLFITLDHTVSCHLLPNTVVCPFA